MFVLNEKDVCQIDIFGIIDSQSSSSPFILQGIFEKKNPQGVFTFSS
jgi:hypothetical protein